MRLGIHLLATCALLCACSSTSHSHAQQEWTASGSALILTPGIECGTNSVAFASGITADDFGDGRAASFAAADGAEYVFSSPAIACEPFDECLVSWNARHSKSTGFGVEIAVARRADAEFSPWMWIGEWNVRERPAEALLAFEDAKIDVDTFSSKSQWRAVRVRVRVRANDPKQLRFALDALALVPTLHKGLSANPAPTEAAPAGVARMAVPFRSQRVEESALAGRICSPTSVSMLLAYRGVDASTAEVARRAYDSFHDIYGNWNRAIQAAYSFGVPGRLERISSWTRAEKLLATGQPLILSIAAKPGQLRNAPYASTSGHLLVLCGFDAQSNALVNDPAAATAELGQLAYTRADLETVWMARGGTTYVLEPMRTKER